MKSHFVRLSTQMRVLQHKLQRLTDQMHTLALLCVGDYIEVTRVITGCTSVELGVVAHIDAESFSLELADGTCEVIDRFLHLRILTPAVDADSVGLGDSEWSSVESP